MVTYPIICYEFLRYYREDESNPKGNVKSCQHRIEFISPILSSPTPEYLASLVPACYGLI